MEVSLKITYKQPAIYLAKGIVAARTQLLDVSFHELDYTHWSQAHPDSLIPLFFVLLH